MTFRNWVVNPVVRLLLGSPLHRLVSSSLVTLAYQGGRTGRWHCRPGVDARDGQDLSIVAAQPHSKVWWRNLRQPARVRLHLQGRDVDGTTTATSDPEAVAAGLGRYLQRYPRQARLPQAPERTGISFAVAWEAVARVEVLQRRRRPRCRQFHQDLPGSVWVVTGMPLSPSRWSMCWFWGSTSAFSTATPAWSATSMSRPWRSDPESRSGLLPAVG
jgi:hypothetical protein